MIDQDEIQMQDETNKTWVQKWLKTLEKELKKNANNSS